MNTFKNMAGYLDPTAGKAINKVDREIAKERKMRENCRRVMRGRGWDKYKKLLNPNAKEV